MERTIILNNLYWIRDRLYEIANIYEEQFSLQSQFRKQKALLETDGLKNKSVWFIVIMIIYVIIIMLLLQDFLAASLIGILGLLYFLFRNRRPCLSKISLIALLLLTGYLLVSFIKLLFEHKNSKDFIVIPLLGFVIALVITCIVVFNKIRKTQNKKIDDHNLPLYDRYDANAQIIDELMKLVVDRGQGWFPPDYYSIEAVVFFINAFINRKADSIKEAVVLFDNAKHQNRMYESNQRLERMAEQQIYQQQETNQLLMTSNLLEFSRQSLMMDQISELRGIRRNIDSIRSETESLRNYLRR